MKVLSLIPPMTQLNTPYPSTAYLTGFLRSHGFDAVQEDLALALVLGFFTQEGLLEIEQEALGLAEENRSASVNFFLDYFDEYQSTISLVIAFLQGRDSTLAHRINSRAFLPEGPRFASLDAYDEEEGSDSLAWAFGALGSQDRARHLATLYLNDLSDVLKDAVDERFEFVRYGESLASSQPTFTPLASALAAAPTLMDQHLKELTKAAIDKHQPQLVLLSVPFPGAMYAALRIAQTIKGAYPHIHIGLGGGYVNTELRELSDPRIFDFVDFITLDSGERPLLALIEHLKGKRSAERLVRTFIRNLDNEVRYIHWQEPDIPFEEVGTATWDGLPLNSYLSLLDMLNPMHRLWSDGRWNKLTVAHGCYWKKCSFCDVSLDYISRYETASASILVDRIEAIVAETGQTGFHFVDEAAPPKALKALAKELIRRKVNISWWGNIRFEKTF
ncbi:MAG: radical SAM protein, partial [Polynucleobacter sp. 35-46-207]